jgi:hypothetical protein
VESKEKEKKKKEKEKGERRAEERSVHKYGAQHCC